MVQTVITIKRGTLDDTNNYAGEPYEVIWLTDVKKFAIFDEGKWYLAPEELSDFIEKDIARNITGVYPNSSVEHK
jgi:hypothetical protein